MNNNIAHFRKKLGLSQHRLGKAVGVSRITIMSIENSKTVPSLRLANNIAKALGQSLYDIFDLS